LQQKAAEIVRAPLARNFSADDRIEKHRWHAERMAGWRQSEKSARVGSVHGERLYDASAQDQQFFVLEGEVGKRREGQAGDVFYSARTANRAADWALDHAVVGVEARDRRGIARVVRSLERGEERADVLRHAQR